MIRLFADDSLLLHGRLPCWGVCCATEVGREDKGGSGYACILFVREDEGVVAVLASAKVTLDGRRVCRQELMGLLDGSLFLLAGVLGE